MDLLNERQRRNRWNCGAAGLSLVRGGRDVQLKSDFGYKNVVFYANLVFSYAGCQGAMIVPINPLGGVSIDNGAQAGIGCSDSAQMRRCPIQGFNDKQVRRAPQPGNSCAAPATVGEISGSHAGPPRTRSHCTRRGRGKARAEPADTPAFRKPGYRPLPSLRTPRECACQGRWGGCARVRPLACRCAFCGEVLIHGLRG